MEDICFLWDSQSWIVFMDKEIGVLASDGELFLGCLDLIILEAISQRFLYWDLTILFLLSTEWQEICR